MTSWHNITYKKTIEHLLVKALQMWYNISRAAHKKFSKTKRGQTQYASMLLKYFVSQCLFLSLFLPTKIFI